MNEPKRIFLITAFLWVAVHVACLFFPFYGLEYEDSYIFSVAGRILSHDWSVYKFGFLTPGVGLGSIADPVFYETYSGHLLGFPTLLALSYQLFGYHLIIAPLINTFCGITAGLVAADVSKRILGNNLGWVALALFTFSPAIVGFHGTGLSEPVSSLFVVLTAWGYVLQSQSSKRFGWAFLIVAMLIKRENVVLLLFPIFDIIANWTKSDRKLLIIRFVELAAVSLVPVLLLRLNGTIGTEESDINQSPFSIAYFQYLLPPFGAAILNPLWCGLSGFLFLFATTKVRKLPREILPILSVALAYTLLYVIHYRSYYFIQNHSATSFEFLRYLTNYYPLVCVFASCAFYNRINGTNALTYVLIAVLAAGCFQTIGLRQVWSKDEYEQRIGPCLAVLNVVPKNGTILTDEPVLYEFVGSQTTQVMNLQSIQDAKGYSEITDRIPTGVFFIENRTLSEDRTRASMFIVRGRFLMDEFARVDDRTLYKLRQ